MRLIELFDPPKSMGDLAQLKQDAVLALKNHEGFKVEIVPYLDQIGVKIMIDGEPASVYFELIKPSPQQFKKQLRAALQSYQRGTPPKKGVDIARELNGKVLNTHALLYLVGSKRWQMVSITIGGKDYKL
jgi:hypothetical protein